MTETAGAEAQTTKPQEEPKSKRLEAHVTRPMFDLSDKLQARIEELDLVETIQHVKDNGYGYIHNPTSIEFNDRLRETILRVSGKLPGSNMLLDKDPIFVEAVLTPKILAVVEVMCGKGAMLSQLACSIRKKGSPPLALHADQNWTPAPFPEHNQMVTFCWACDEFNKDNGSTKLIPKSHFLRRHPSAEEIKEEKRLVATECPAGSITFWDGSIWHGGGTRTTDGERVVMHMTYSRLALRPVESYDHLGDDWLEDKPYEMKVLLGREDFLNKNGGAFANIMKLQRTMRWAKT